MTNLQKPALQTIDAADTAAILAAVTADGACIARNVLPVDLCEQLLEDFAGHLGDLNWGKDELGYRDNFYGSQTKRLHGLFSKSSSMVEVLTHPLFLSLAQAVLVETGVASDIRLSNAELMVLNQGQGTQVLHTDGASWPVDRSGEILLSANCALTEFTQANGATRVVPGSHRWPAERKPLETDICYAEMPRGAALIYSGNVLHSGGANTTNTARSGLYLGYVVSWLRPLENQLITNNPADILALPAKAQALLDVVPGGFTVYA